jgi:hypothetical protein
LKELCKSFFYVGKNKIAARYPNAFRNEVPRFAVALAATAVRFPLVWMLTTHLLKQIHCALDEWKTGQ